MKEIEIKLSVGEAIVLFGAGFESGFPEIKKE